MALQGNPQCFTVSYRYRKNEKAGWTRTIRHGNISQWGLPPSRSETAVVSALRRAHSNAEVMIDRLTWDDEK